MLTTPRKPGVPRTTVRFFALLPRPRVRGYTDIDIASYPRRERRTKKRIVVRGTPGFLGVVGACVCNRYQALFAPPSWPGYEAREVGTYIYIFFLCSLIGSVMMYFSACMHTFAGRKTAGNVRPLATKLLKVPVSVRLGFLIRDSNIIELEQNF